MSEEPYDKISFNLPHRLLERIDEAAASDRRNRTSWLIYNLERLLEKSHLEDGPGDLPPPGKPTKYPKG